MLNLLIAILGIIGILIVCPIFIWFKSADTVSFNLFRFHESKEKTYFDILFIEIGDWDGSLFGLYHDLESGKPRWVFDILFMRFGEGNEEESEIS